MTIMMWWWSWLWWQWWWWSWLWWWWWWWSWPWLSPSQSAPLFRKRGVADEDESLHCQSCFYLNLSLILFTSIFQIFDQKKAEGDTKRWLTRDCHTVTVIFTSFNYIRDFFPSGGGVTPLAFCSPVLPKKGNFAWNKVRNEPKRAKIRLKSAKYSVSPLCRIFCSKNQLFHLCGKICQIVFDTGTWGRCGKCDDKSRDEKFSVFHFMIIVSNMKVT